MSVDNAAIKVTAYYDVNCPWCYVGQKRLVKAVDQFGGAAPVELEWKPFIIDPKVSIDGEAYSTYSVKRWGRPYPMERLLDEGGREGIGFTGWQWWANSSRAFQFVEYGLRLGVHSLLTTRVLFEAHFDKGENLSLVDTLVRLAVENFPAWNAEELRSYLEENKGKESLLSEVKKGKDQDGCREVPYFVIESSTGQRFQMKGSHSAEAFVEKFTEAIGDPNADIREDMDL